MAENSKIEWTDHTFNPWEGCTKVSPGRRNSFTIELGWWVVPMILRQIFTAWQKERSNRINEIGRLDEALKGGQGK